MLSSDASALRPSGNDVHNYYLFNWLVPMWPLIPFAPWSLCGIRTVIMFLQAQYLWFLGFSPCALLPSDVYSVLSPSIPLWLNCTYIPIPWTLPFGACDALTLSALGTCAVLGHSTK